MTWQGFALVLGGAFLFALYETINKKLLVKKAPADCISTVNFLGGGVLLLVVSLFCDPPKIESWFEFPGGLFWPLAATCLLNIIILFGNVRALKHSDVSLVAPIAATQPLIVLIPAWMILREAPTSWGYVGLMLLGVGMYIFSLLEHIEKLKDWRPPIKYFAPWIMLFKNKGVRIALLVAICGAVSINFDKAAALRSSVTFAPACILLFCGLSGFLKTRMTKEWQEVNRSHFFNLCLNPFVYAAVLICYWAAFDYGLAAYVGALKRMTVIFALILAWLLLGEKKVLQRWPGAIIMAIGAALLSL